MAGNSFGSFVASLYPATADREATRVRYPYWQVALWLPAAVFTLDGRVAQRLTRHRCGRLRGFARNRNAGCKKGQRYQGHSSLAEGSELQQSEENSDSGALPNEGMSLRGPAWHFPLPQRGSLTFFLSRGKSFTAEPDQMTARGFPGSMWSIDGKRRARIVNFCLQCSSSLVHYLMVIKQARPKRAFGFRLSPHSGIPVYRQLMDQVQAALATGSLRVGDQLPTVRSVAVDLTINPNTVLRAYREMEIRGLLETQQGSGTFIAQQEMKHSREGHERQLITLTEEFVSRAGYAGFTIDQLIHSLQTLLQHKEPKRR